jgi:hypothetical protein
VPCVYCGATRTTKEHVWPKWLRKILPDYTKTTYTHQRGDEPPRVWEDVAAAITVGVVCGDCNHGWMNDLENAARPLLEPMIAGRRTTLDKPEQRALAAWGIKTAMMLEQTNPATASIPASHYAFLHEHKEPPSTTFAWLAATDAKKYTVFYHGHGLDLHIDHQEVPSAEGYVATIAIRHLALQIIGTQIEDAEFEQTGALGSAVSQIWPFRRSFRWPVGLILDPTGLDALAVHWRGNA